MSQFDPDIVLRKNMNSGKARSTGAVNQARRTGGAVETSQKYGAGGNKGGGGMDAAKLDRETEELKHKSVDKNVGKLIAQGRAAKGYTQKELATKINEKPQIINEYEQGKGIPNQQILGKIERHIGVKLRGKNIGQPLGGGGGGKKKK